MGKIILIVGNSGVGKTTLTQALCQLSPFATGLEQQEERPFQALMAGDLPRYALANQIDYLLLRAEQEQALRLSDNTGLLDGGLDLDYYGFTHLFYQKGYLNEAEFHLCGRFYRLMRDLLGPPDLILYLSAPIEVIEDRYAQRGRQLEIARREDLLLLAGLVERWLQSITTVPVLRIDASTDDYTAPNNLKSLTRQINHILSRSDH